MENPEKQILKSEYQEQFKDVKKCARSDRKVYTEKLEDEAETAVFKGDVRKISCITKTLASKFQSSDLSIKDQQGNLISKEYEILTRWRDDIEKQPRK